MDKIEGYIEVGTNENHEVVINLDKDRNGIGHLIFSVRQAKELANTILKQAMIARCGAEGLPNPFGNTTSKPTLGVWGHHENCDTRDRMIQGKPCNCYVLFKRLASSESEAKEKAWQRISDLEKKLNIPLALLDSSEEEISQVDELLSQSQRVSSRYFHKIEQLRELASHNLDEREKLITGIRDSLKFLNNTRHTWNGPIHRAVSLLEGLVHSADGDDWHERYHQENPDGECRFCDPK